MLDIKLIRENPDKINELLKRRNPELSIDEVIKIDEERRKIQTQADELRAKRKKDSQMIGELKKKGENTKVAIRNIRRDANDAFKKMEKADEISEDDLAEAEEKIQKLTDKMIAEVDKAIEAKTKEIMTV